MSTDKPLMRPLESMSPADRSAYYAGCLLLMFDCKQPITRSMLERMHKAAIEARDSQQAAVDLARVKARTWGGLPS